MAAVVQYTEGNRTAYFFLIYVNVIMVTATTWKSEVSSYKSVEYVFSM